MKTLKSRVLHSFRTAYAAWSATRFDPVVSALVVIVLIVVAVVANDLGQIQGYDQAFAYAQRRNMELVDELAAVRTERDNLRAGRTHTEYELDSANRVLRNVERIIAQQR